MVYSVYILLSVVLLPLTHGFSRGAPGSACGRMFPLGHQTAAQGSPPPYTLTWSREGQDYQVTLTGTSDFKGFFIEARDVGSDDPLGAWIPGSNGRLRPCPDASSGPTGVTHGNNDDKRSVTNTWIPAGADISNTRFVATVVEEFSTFWLGVESPFVF